MKKLKNLVILLIVFSLIIIGANLPQIVGAIQDKAAANNAGYSPIQSIALDISGIRKPLSTTEKLILLRQNKTISINASEATMTEDDVYATVAAYMDQYASVGIFEWFNISNQKAQPFICIDPDNPECYNIFWSVTYINKKEPNQNLLVDIDDETGNIFSIRYDIYDSYDLNGVWERNYTTLDAFSSLYLQQLGLYENNTNTAPALDEYLERDGEVLCGRFSFKDAEYGEIIIELYVNGVGGFFTHFP